jgi:hypothetical protein
MLKKDLRYQEDKQKLMTRDYRLLQTMKPSVLSVAKNIKNDFFDKISKTMGLSYSRRKKTFTKNGQEFVIEDYMIQLGKEIRNTEDYIQDIKRQMYEIEKAIEPLLQYEPTPGIICPCCYRPL